MSATQRIIDRLKARNDELENSWHPAAKPVGLSPREIRLEQELNTEKIGRLERSLGSHGTF